jgi:hypothetical protein
VVSAHSLPVLIFRVKGSEVVPGSSSVQRSSRFRYAAAEHSCGGRYVSSEVHP